MKKKYPECFGSNPNVIDQAENDCCRCNYQDDCSKQSMNTIIKISKVLDKTDIYEKEFEYRLYNNGIQINESVFFQELVDKWFAMDDKVKIKVRKGCIQIERMD